MAEDIVAIRPADLRVIERNLSAIHNDLEVIDSGVDTVNSNVKVVYDEIGKLAKDFSDFVQRQLRAHEEQILQAKLIEI